MTYSTLRTNIERSVTWSNRAHIDMPALFISPAIAPKAFTPLSIRFRQASELVTSVGTATALPPALMQASAVVSKAAWLRAASTRLAPCWASLMANARPIPAEAPVMTKVLLVKVTSLFHWLRLEKTDVLVSDSFSPGKHILSLPSCYDRQIELNTTPLASSS